MFLMSVKSYKHTPIFLATILFLLLFLMPSISEAAANFASLDPAGMLTNAMKIFRDAAGEAGRYIVGPAQKLMYALIVIELTWTGISWVLAPTDLDLQTIVGSLVKKIMYFSLVLFIVHLMGQAIINDNNILSNTSWINTVPNSFAAIGDDIVSDTKETGGLTTFLSVTSAMVSGLSFNFDNLGGPVDTIGEPQNFQANPGNILNGGICLALFFLIKILVSFINPGLLLPFNIFLNAFLFIFAVGVAFMIVMEFSLLAIDLMINFIECYIVMAASIFIISMAVTRWSAMNITTYVNYLVSLGMRIVINMTLFTVGTIILTNVIAQTGNPGSSAVPFKGTWDLIVNTFGSMFFMSMLFKKSPDIATGFLTNTPMLSAGDGMKAGVSAFKSALQGATSSAGIVGGGMATAGKVAQGKAIFKAKDTKDKDGNVTKVGEGIKLSKGSLKQFAKGEIEFKSSGGHSGVKKDMKKTKDNLLFKEGSRTSDAVKFGRAAHQDKKFGDSKTGGLKTGAKILAGISSDKHTQNPKTTAAKNLAGKQLTGAGHLVKGAGKFMGEQGMGGKTLGKTLGSLEKMAPGDAPSPNLLAMIQFDPQN
ncbi:MAG: hypothetical protein V4525_14830 [Pseudomonadota bacterium]